MRTIIFPYKFGSRSAKILVKSINAVRVRDTGRYVKRAGDLVINWGNTKIPSWGESNLNKESSVINSVDKKIALQKMKDAEVRTVPFTDNTQVVTEWLNQGHTVYARTLTRASEGRGIKVITKGMSIPYATLYTKGIESQNEYRIHVFRGTVIDYTKKIPISYQPNPLIKSHNNGWTFARNLEQRNKVKEEAVKAVEALGLDFGAVDVITNPLDKNRPYILEVNTACGLNEDGRTLKSYSDAIKNYAKNN